MMKLIAEVRSIFASGGVETESCRVKLEKRARPIEDVEDVDGDEAPMSLAEQHKRMAMGAVGGNVNVRTLTRTEAAEEAQRNYERAVKERDERLALEKAAKEARRKAELAEGEVR